MAEDPTTREYVYVDKLTEAQIAGSIRGGLAKFMKLAGETDGGFERYIRRMLNAGDYSSVKRRKRDGTAIPEWERAYAHVMSVRDFARRLAGRARDGRLLRAEFDEKTHAPVSAESLAACPVTVLEPVVDDSSDEPKAVSPLAKGVTVAGYVYDPSWTNGGFSSFAAEMKPDPIGVRVKHVQGIAAFQSVEKVGGIPELAWFYCGADFELGLSSWFDGVTGMALTGGTPGESNGGSPKGPGDFARLAAAEHRRILGYISGLAPRHERAIRTAYTDTRCPRQLKADYGEGVALIVWRAQQEAGETDPKGVAYTTPGPRTLARLVEAVRADFPTYDGHPEGETIALSVRIERAASLVLWVAHEHYRLRAGDVGPTPRERAVHALIAEDRRASLPQPRAKNRKRRRKPIPIFVAEGKAGAARRRLVEVQEVVLPDGHEPRAA